MTAHAKPIDSLQDSDLGSHPVWRYKGGTMVVPVARLPVSDLTGKVVGTRVVLANGERVWALIGNVDVSNPRLTQHFLTISLEHKGSWITLARYHDFDYLRRGPNGFAVSLGRRIDEIFPISYDIRRYVKGDSAALTGKIYEEPKEKLSRAEVIAMAVPKVQK